VWGVIYNSYSTGSVSGVGDNLGGLIGLSEGASIFNSFWDINFSGQETSAGDEIGKTTEEMKTQSTFSGWDFSTVWAINSNVNEGYPYLINNPPR